MGGGQASQSLNKKKFKMLKKKRNEGRNRKKVFRAKHGNQVVVSSFHPSKKRLKKDAKRLKHHIDSEKQKLLASGLISKEDVEKLEEQQQEQEQTDPTSAASPEEATMDVDA